MYKILYVDEEIKCHHKFKRYTGGHLNVDVVIPHDELSDLLKYMLESEAHAVVIDHKLGDKKPNVNYDGADVFREFRKIKAHFPLFILTSFDEDAIAEAEDVNHVYPKSVMDRSLGDTSEQVTFNDRIIAQIKHYQKRVSNAEIVVLQLIEKASSEALTADEEANLIELDKFLSGEVGKSLDIPEQLKEPTNTELTQELIAVSKQLIKAITNKQK